MKLLGPFAQILTLRNLPMHGPIADEALEIISNGGVVVMEDLIIAVDAFDTLQLQYPDAAAETMPQPAVLLPGFIDCHTHICFGGNRSRDYAMRIAGKPYLEIAKAGGGIWSSVQMTREAAEAQLLDTLLQRIERHVAEGVTTIEIKSGYGLNTPQELKMLRVIQQAAAKTTATIVATCLAAHMKPKDFDGSENEYLATVLTELLPQVKAENLASRVDIFVEETAFSREAARAYLQQAKALGFELTVHADQFTAGSSVLAIEVGAVSADHLEASGDPEIAAFTNSETVAVVLPGASLGLGMHFSPARRLLNAGACVAIASDWNPGSAPNGDLLMQAAVLSAFEKLTTAETFAGLTFRAAKALKRSDRGLIAPGMKAHLQAYPTSDYRDILYNQGKMKAVKVWC